MEMLRKHEIPYYWDRKLNLLETRADREFSRNIANHILAIINEFKKSVSDESVNPMRHFGW